METLQQLKAVYATLSKITVAGDENIERMYGCFCTLAQVIKELENKNLTE